MLVKYRNYNDYYNVPPIQKNTSKTINTKCYPLYYENGLNTALFTIDPLNKVKELNESNNKFKLRF